MGKVLAALFLAMAFGAAPALAQDLTHCNAGMAHQQKNEFSSAHTEFKLCLTAGKLTPANAANAHLGVSAAAYGLKKWPEVVSEYDLAVKSFAAAGQPFKPEAPSLFFRGVALAQMHQLKDARASLEQAIALAPTQWEIVMTHMEVVAAMGDAGAALADGAKMAASGDPKVAVLGHMRRGALFRSQKKLDDALTELNAAAALDPKNMEIVLIRLNLYMAMNQPDKALADGATVAASPTANVAAQGHFLRAEIFHGQHKDDDALGELDAALKAEPYEPQLLFARFSLLEDTGKEDKALADAATLIASKDSRGVIAGHAFRGMVYDKGKRYAEALAEADAIVKLDPKNSVGLNNRCMALANLGRGPESVATCQKALAADPNSPTVWNSMGYALEKAGRLKEAATYYKKAAAATPNDPANKADLARVQAALAATPSAAAAPVKVGTHKAATPKGATPALKLPGFSTGPQ